MDSCGSESSRRWTPLERDQRLGRSHGIISIFGWERGGWTDGGCPVIPLPSRHPLPSPGPGAGVWRGPLPSGSRRDGEGGTGGRGNQVLRGWVSQGSGEESRGAPLRGLRPLPGSGGWTGDGVGRLRGSLSHSRPRSGSWPAGSPAPGFRGTDPRATLERVRGAPEAPPEGSAAPGAGRCGWRASVHPSGNRPPRRHGLRPSPPSPASPPSPWVLGQRMVAGAEVAP